MGAFLFQVFDPVVITRMIIVGLVMLFVGMGINRYLFYRSVKSIQRRIKDAEAKKFVLDYLATSDRFILLYSFRRIFGFIIFGCFAFSIITFLLCLQSSTDLARGSINFAISMTLAGVAIVSATTGFTMKQLEKYPESIETINQEIEALKMRLSKLTE